MRWESLNCHKYIQNVSYAKCPSPQSNERKRAGMCDMTNRDLEKQADKKRFSP
jgi:hypothetical protein